MAGTLKLLWFFLWRMVLWGVVLGAAAGAIFIEMMLVTSIVIGFMNTGMEGDLDVGAGVFWIVGSGVIFGVLGGVVGLCLGLLCSLLLFAITRAFHWHWLTENARSYRRMVGWTCASTSGLALLVNWVLHSGFPDPAAFVLLRPFGYVPSYGGTPSVFNIVVGVVVPTLLFSLAMWWAGRRVAGRYASSHGDSAPGERAGERAVVD